MLRMTSLAGREAERAALRAFLTAERGTRPPVMLVSGEAGIGKTALVEEVLTGGCQRAGRGWATEWKPAAYEPVARALRSLPGARPAVAPELAVVLPELGSPPPTVSTSALALAVCGTLTAGQGGRGAGTVLFLDDLQWADEATLDLLPALADAMAGGPAVLVGCYRGDELPRQHRLRQVRAVLRRQHRLAEIELGPLSAACVGQMLAGLLAAEPAGDLAAAVAARGDGVPFVVEELAFALRAAGHVTVQGGVAALVGHGGDLVPEGVREAVLLRTARLPADLRTLLDAAAVAGNEFDVDLLLAVTGIPAWPDELAATGLVSVVSDGRAAFRHALTRDAVYADVPWSRRRELHRRLADRLTEAGEPAALIAGHLLAARETAAARDALLAAAADHCAVHAYRDAASALRTALDLWPLEPGDATRLAVVDRLAHCAEMCADHAECVALLRELEAGHRRSGARRELALTSRRLARSYEMLGQWDAALASRESAARRFSAAGNPAEAATERLLAAAHLRSAGSFTAAIAAVKAARADAETAGRPDLLLRAEGLRGNVLARMGHGEEGVAAVRAALEQALARALPGPAAELHQRLADSLEHAGDYRGAAGAYAAGHEFCQAHGEETAGQLCRACVTAVLFAAGRWDRALEVCDDVTGSGQALVHAVAVGTGIRGLIHAFRGSPGRARRDLLAAVSLATRIELAAMELISAWGLCVADDQAGAVEECRARAARLLARWEDTEEAHYTVPILQWLATFFARAGDAAGARSCAAALSRIAGATGAPEALAALAHALGETAWLDGAPSVAAQELARAADAFAALDLPLATAQSRQRAAAALIEEGDAARAAKLLRDAHRTFTGLGARALRAQCQAGLARIGEKRPRGARRGLAGLSQRELEVMRLVGQGQTSREIAGQLFLSPRTVEMYVSGSMQKLGCRTRAEAVRRLSELTLAGA
jgi:DNA-binding CsgD family transcriptional regulator